MSNEKPLPPNPHRGLFLPPIEVDTSNWVGMDELASVQPQPARSLAVTLPPFECEFIEPKSVEIVLRMGPEVSAETAFQLALDLIHAIKREFPQLKLEYDPERTRTESGQVTIALTPQVYLPDDTALQEVVDRINHAGFQVRGLNNPHLNGTMQAKLTEQAA